MATLSRVSDLAQENIPYGLNSLFVSRLYFDINNTHNTDIISQRQESLTSDYPDWSKYQEDDEQVMMMTGNARNRTET